jgi:peptide/nickel transport system substrate-binding protein
MHNPHLRDRMHRSRLTIFGAALLGLALVVSACSSSGGTSGSSARATTLIIGTPMQSEGPWDPALAFEDIYRMVFKASYDTLITYKGDNYSQLVPDAAESWSASPDGTTYTFKLNPKITFNSGDKMTSADVKFSLLRLKYIQGAPSAFVSEVKSIDAPDPETVVIHLTAPDYNFLLNLVDENVVIYDSKVAEKHGANDNPDANKTDTAESYLNHHSVGSGPYQIEQYVPEQKLVLDLNPHYWRKAPYFKSIVFTNVATSQEQIAAVQRGDIDMTRELSPTDIASVKNDKNLQITGSPSVIYYLFGMTRNCSIDPAVCKPQVQEAIHDAIDYNAVESLAKGMPAWYGVIPPYIPGGVQQSNAPEQNLAKAKQLLAAAGYPHGFKTTICTSTATSTQPSMLDDAQLIQGDLQKIGITVSIDARENSAFLTQFRDDQCHLIQTIEGPEVPDPSFIQVFLPNGLYGLRVDWKTGNLGSDGAQYVQEEKTALGTSNPTQARALWHQIAVQMQVESPWIPETTVQYQVAAASNIVGVGHGDNQEFIFDPYTLSRK